MALRRRSFTALLALTLVACDGDKGLTGPAGPVGPPGDEGPQGPPGTSSDGGAAVRLYGDGRDGALDVPAGTTFLPLDSTGQYTTITIATGGTLRVASGTLLRATGDIDNDGTIEVDPATFTGVRRYGSTMADLAPATVPPHPGVALSAAEFGSVDMSSTFVAYGGAGGRGIGRAARWLTQLFPSAGGAGADSWPFDAVATESGGGSFHLRSGGEIRNAGTIRARGVDGGFGGLGGCGVGGGGGGAVLLAAATQIDNGGGAIDVRGGNGQAADGDQCGAGGGGGGGFVHLIAPVIDAGDLQFTGGQAGTAGVYGSLRWIGGGGGGGSAGNGGRGTGRINATVSAASGGGTGAAYQIVAAPETAL
ncbi:MAG: hypothetical protein ACAI38_00555 [Myxococcota bacterium]